VYFCRKKSKKISLTIRQFNTKFCLLRCSGLFGGNLLGTVLRGRKLPGVAIQDREMPPRKPKERYRVGSY